MSETDTPGPRVVIRRGRRPVPRGVWLLVALIVLFFAVGVLFVMTGLFVPGQGVEPPPGPTAFTLTPQMLTLTPGP